MTLKTENFEDLLSRDLFGIDFPQPLGLISGNTSLILLLSHQYNLSKNVLLLDRMISLVNQNVEYIALNQKLLDCSLGYGLTGFAHTLSIIESLEDPSIPSFDDILNQLDLLFLANFSTSNEIFHLDHFSGLNGMINYAIGRLKLKPIVLNYVRYLNGLKSVNGLWSRNVEGVEYINLGVPHGLTGNLFLINRLIQNGFEVSESVIKLLISFLFVHNKFSLERGFYFPGRVIKDNYDSFFCSNLSWCYGDLPIGVMLFEISETLKDETLREFAMEILNSTLSSTKASEDSSLCHGSISIAHLYNTAFLYTNELVFSNAKEIWIEKAKTEVANKNLDLFFEDFSLFTGFTGYYLSILEFDHGLKSNWKKILYL